jgi:hypothetical protein
MRSGSFVNFIAEESRTMTKSVRHGKALAPMICRHRRDLAHFVRLLLQSMRLASTLIHTSLSLKHMNIPEFPFD